MAKIWMPAGAGEGDVNLKQVTADANALPEDILENKTAYVRGERITGSLERRESGLSNTGLDWRVPTLIPGQSVSPGSGNDLYVGFPKGAYLDSDSKLSCPAVTIPYEQRTATPTKSSQVITSGSGKVLEQVTVKAIPSNYYEFIHISEGDTLTSGESCTVTLPNVQLSKLYNINVQIEPNSGTTYGYGTLYSYNSWLTDITFSVSSSSTAGRARVVAAQNGSNVIIKFISSNGGGYCTVNSILKKP